MKAIDDLAAIYNKIGYQTLKISATEGLNIDGIECMMQDKVSMFSGHSGVGKSTLINVLAPDLNLKTAAISDQHQQGAHTTTFAEMFVLPKGMKLIDTPGIKGFGVVNMQIQEIANYFPEFKKLNHVSISIKENLNIDELILKIKNNLKNKFITSDDILITRERHRQHLEQCLQHLKNFNKKNEVEDFDKAAEDLRLATRHLGMIVGKVDVEEILGSIFNDFCIGK